MTVGFWTTVWPRLCLLAAAAALILPCEPASADVLTVMAVGRIDPVCEISVLTPAPTVDFGASGGANAGALVNCNTGFAIRATSANGAVITSATASPGFANSLAYTLGLTVPLTGSSWISATCASPSLLAGKSGCALSPGGPGLQSGGFPSIQRAAKLKFTWNTAGKRPLVAGSYEDTITLSIAATP